MSELNAAARAQHEAHRAIRARIGMGRSIRPPKAIQRPALAHAAPIQIPNSARRVFVETAVYFGLKFPELVGQGRKHRFARPRQIAIFLARKLTSQSTTQIGKIAGGRDHSTVIHAVKRIGGLIEFGDKPTIDAVKAIEARI